MRTIHAGAYLSASAVMAVASPATANEGVWMPGHRRPFAVAHGAARQPQI